MIKARRIGHVTFETPDIGRQIEYYTQVVGLVLAERDKSSAYLTTRVGQLAVQLEQGTAARCTRVSFEVAPGLEPADIQKRLAASGFDSSRRSEPVPGMKNTVVLQDPRGTAVELFSEWSFVTKNQQSLGVGPLKLGHVASAVLDPRDIASFYERSLGFRVSDWIEDFFVFQRCGPDHHTLNFIKGDRNTLHHVAFELKDFAHMQQACDVLAQHRIPIAQGPLRHGPGHNIAIYHANPDGLIIEFFIELDQMKDEELGYFEPKPWHRDFPQRPKTWSRKDNGTVIWGTRTGYRSSPN
jgi:catechol 2,3-dioxygenase-like lactoylglutathione lyase family enzyme